VYTRTAEDECEQANARHEPCGSREALRRRHRGCLFAERSQKWINFPPSLILSRNYENTLQMFYILLQ